jgi:hypothetical protein
MIFQGYYNNPERYLFRFVLIEHADDYIAQGWEIVGMMQNTIFALNSVTSYVMAFNFG